ncbi:neuroendocrine convertase 2-like isoform X2 [Ruditapes philippinarum]|uniref:neuroendocrine convertase 2-like isoform X2 n=1 Tax=Ruditapes philippinarum TaxID=129788 RepID=UPI00295AC379|nr:neuroendocrine convertase 2-like isoform X2 [Ruditapes philippinarum]
MKIVRHFCFFLSFWFMSVNGETNRFVFKIKSRFHEFEKLLSVYNFTDMLKITPSVFSFKYDGFESRIKTEQVLTEVKRDLADAVIEIEQAKVLTIGKNWILADEKHEGDEQDVIGDDVNSELAYDTTKEGNKHNAFGMNVERAWSNGATGEGINIAVLDVGVNTNLTDLKRNINMVLAKNFIDNTHNVVPEHFHSYQAESLYIVDHGNRCTSVIAAERGNGRCGDGIAYEAKVVPLKVFEVMERNHHFRISITSDVVAAGLAHAPQQIHIYSNSWSPTDKFEPLDLSMREAIHEGVMNGRGKLGSIYVVPDGSEKISGSGLANSVNTITVNYVGFNGQLPRSPQVSASVLTSGLGEGNRIYTYGILTSTLNDKCIKSFKGGSAAVAELSAIIALVLQARPVLTMRDIQHLLVESSTSKELGKSVKFERNAAGKLFNSIIGFGLIDAGKMVNLSKSWTLVENLHSNTLHRLGDVSKDRNTHNNLQYDSEAMTYTISFKMDENRCGLQVLKVEHVILFMNYYIITQRSLMLKIISPGGTHSIIVDNSDDPTFSTDQSDRNLTSVHFWGECPIGIWRVVIQLSQEIGKFS